MGTVNSVLTNFDSGNYHGRLYSTTPTDTPFSTLANAFSPGGGEIAYARTFEWQTFDLRASSSSNQVADNADAPTSENRSRDNVTNVLQTHTETVGVGFERMAQTGQFNVPGSSALDAENIDQGANPVSDELTWQRNQMWKQVKRDVEDSLINSTKSAPSSNTAAQTGGLIEAITTNAIASGGGKLTYANLSDAMQSAWDEGGLTEGDARFLFVPSEHKRHISEEFHTKNLQPRSERRFGVNVQVIETDFGDLNVVLNRYVPDGTALIVSMDQIKLWHRLVPPHDNIPGGVTFTYRNSRSGNRTEYVLYTSVGLEWGNEKAHAKITGLATNS